MIKWGIFPRVLSALLRYHVYELFSCNDTVLIIKEERTILCTSICYSFISSFFFWKIWISSSALAISLCDAHTRYWHIVDPFVLFANFVWMDVNDWTSNTIIISGNFSCFCASEIDSAICTCERWQYNILNCNEGIGYVYVLTFRVEFLFAHGFQSKSSIRPTSTCQLC